MFRNLAIIATFVAAASAFQPLPVNRVNHAAAISSNLKMDELGVLPPLGLFDPLNLMEDKEGFARRRAVEIKHGRIAMAAFVGMLVQELGITFPGYINLDQTVAFADIGTGFAALGKIPAFGLYQILLFCGLAELFAIPASQYSGGPQNLPGGYDGVPFIIPGGYPFTTQIEDPAERTKKLNIEIQNGRAAMLGVFGAMCHDVVDSTNHHFFYPLTGSFYTAS